MIHLILYAAALAVNLGWLFLGDGLSLLQQVCVPFLTVALAGDGSPAPPLEAAPVCTAAICPRARCGAAGLLPGHSHGAAVFGRPVPHGPGMGRHHQSGAFHTICNYLRYYRNTGSHVSILNLLGNVVIMVPLGMLVPLLFRPMRRFWLSLPLFALVSVGVEYLQWLTATGAADVDDSILNFIGAAAGYVLVRCLQMVYGAVKRKGK